MYHRSGRVSFLALLLFLAAVAESSACDGEAKIIQRLKRHGIDVYTSQGQNGEQVRLVVFAKWAGDNRDVRHLAKLRNVAHIYLRGSKLSDKDWRYLARMKSLQLIDVTGTTIPADVRASLRKANPKLVVFDTDAHTVPLDYSGKSK